MMNSNKSANISLAFVCIFMILSFCMGAKQYTSTRDSIIANLNSALGKSVKMNAKNWLCRDTIQSYVKLQKSIGKEVTIHTSDRIFADALPKEIAKQNPQIQINVLRMDSFRGGGISAGKIDDGYLMSDTIMLVDNSRIYDTALSMRGYIYCPFTKVLYMSDMKVPLVFLLLALCFGVLSIVIKRNSKKTNLPSSQKDIVSFGGLVFCNEDNCIYDISHNRINFTPMEYSLMEMFYKSSSHFLLKKDICDALWPGKDNADESLYTLVRRLKQTLSECCNVKIMAVRGRAYQLEIK
ncbi:MAG: winged helix-turn-helix domain-containing protein [Prevotella sp.]|nr:winged helix-turn-helix domain-containing protein [Prevotella sp.]